MKRDELSGPALLPRSPLPDGHALEAEVRDALVRAGGEALADLYDGWARLRSAQARAAAERGREADRLEQRGSYVLRSIESARSLGEGPAGPRSGKKAALAAAGAYRGATAEARREMAGARSLLKRRSREEERFFASAIGAVKRRILERADAMARALPPRLSAQAQPVGRGAVLLHLERPSPDEALLWSRALSGKLFTRYEAFFDDSVDDLALGPARLYAEEGCSDARPGSADAEDRVALDLAGPFAPVKGLIALRVPGHDFPRFRVVNRGPLAEVEARDEGSDYANLLPRPAAELFTGYLIRLRMEKKLDLALQLA